MPKLYWLMKSEPEEYSISDLESEEETCFWDGVRNYQARNLMRSMKAGDGVFFYHSVAKPPGIAGIARVCREAYPDHTQFEPEDKHYDPKSDPENPRWSMVDIEFVTKFEQLIPLPALREMADLEGMALLQRGQRLSVQPVTAGEWKIICKKAGVEPGIV